MKKTKQLFCMLIGAFLLCALPLPAIAQDDLAELTPPPPDKSFLDTILAGGWAMIPLGILSFSALGLTFYNAYALRRKNFIQEDVLEQVKQSMGQLDVQGAHSICEANPSPAANIIKHGLEQVMHDPNPETLQTSLEEASIKELAQPYVIVSYISVIAAIAPMVGLLGTVSGMVKAFNAIAAQGMGKPELLADNISEALITTASGMVVGIPAMLFFFIFKNIYGKLYAEISLIVGESRNAFTTAYRQYYGGAAAEEYTE